MKPAFPYPTLKTVKEFLRHRGIRAKRSLGQNFLVDRNTAERIISQIGDAGEIPVLEIGPGLGAFTCLLADICQALTVVELDTSLARRLARITANTDVIEANILDLSPAGLLPAAPACITLGNLPFNLSVKILLWWLDAPPRYSKAYFIFQKEVADRLVAAKSTSSYGSLTLRVSYSAIVKKLFKIPSTVFFPRPEVAGSLVMFSRRPQPEVTVPDQAFYFNLIEAAFAYRRKTLTNSLRLYPKFKGRDADLRKLIENAGFPKNIRAEELVPEDFVVLSEVLAEL